MPTTNAEPQRSAARSPAPTPEREAGEPDDRSRERCRGGVQPQVGGDPPVAAPIADRQQRVEQGSLCARLDPRHQVARRVLVDAGERTRGDECREDGEGSAEEDDRTAAQSRERSYCSQTASTARFTATAATNAIARAVRPGPRFRKREGPRVGPVSCLALQCARQESNLRPFAPEANALSPELRAPETN